MMADFLVVRSRSDADLIREVPESVKSKYYEQIQARCFDSKRSFGRVFWGKRDSMPIAPDNAECFTRL